MKVQGECSTDETPGCCMTYQVNHLYRRPGAYRTHTLTRSLTPTTTVHKRTGRTTDSPAELGSLFTSVNGFSATYCLRSYDHSCTPYLLETVSGFVHTFGHFCPLQRRLMPPVFIGSIINILEIIKTVFFTI
jgi:hypothetical protein